MLVKQGNSRIFMPLLKYSAGRITEMHTDMPTE